MVCVLLVNCKMGYFVEQLEDWLAQFVGKCKIGKSILLGNCKISVDFVAKCKLGEVVLGVTLRLVCILLGTVKLEKYLVS